ncbi:hypothetical protein ABI59_10235 [Acidobacteria bacterium Mor1]|nr:hypothetical protein ABI59_10235 [Acidobacteria bacterium Mor1]
MSGLNAVSAIGFCALAALAWLAGGCRRPVPWRTVLGSAGLMAALGVLIFLLPATRGLLLWLNGVVVALLDASREGAIFLFGPLAVGPGQQTPAGEASVGFVLGTQVLPAVVFFAALMAALYHLGVIQPIVRFAAWVFKNSLRLSGAEALAGASNIFVGIESSTTVRPYLDGMTRSELLTLLTCMMSTIASTTLALYVLFLGETFPGIAGHLISASVLSIPAAVITSKLMLPETGVPETLGTLPPAGEGERHGNTMSALAAGGWDGLKLAAGIATLLIAVLGLLGVLNRVLAFAGAPLEASLGGPLSLDRMLGWVFTPVAWLLGIEAGDTAQAARLLGLRSVATEIPAYQQLAGLAAEESISRRSLVVMSYALCGFAHLASMGIFVGGVAALAPARRDDLTSLAFRALIAATLATLMTGALAGVLYYGQPGVLGLGN